MVPLQFLRKNHSLKFPELIVIKVAVSIFVTNPENPEQRLLKVGSDLVAELIVKRGSWKEHSLLCATDNVDQSEVLFGGALDTHLNLFEV